MGEKDSLSPDMQRQDGDVGTEKIARKWGAFDFIAVVIGVLLVVVMACATAYGVRYSNVDEEPVPGLVNFMVDGMHVYGLQINDDMTATVEYCQEKLNGSLKLAGATTDTILYQLKDIEVVGKPEVDDAIVFVRIPRTGLQGDLSGKWVIYCRSDKLKVNLSLWVYTYPDGTAMYGRKKNTNAMIQQDYRLLEWSKKYKWWGGVNVLTLMTA